MVKKKQASEKTAAEEKRFADKRVYAYWMSCIGRAKKEMPTKKWEAAQQRYSAKSKEGEDNRPYVNDCRKLHESSMSFLDQQEPSFKVSPAEAWMDSEIAMKQAECDSAYLKAVWREQHCQKAQSRKLNSALLKNDGYTLHQFDVKKWMPFMRYLKPENVLLDSDGDGIEENANWKGYFETIPLEEFKSWHPDLPKGVIDSIKKKAGSVLTEDEREDMDDEYVPMYRTVTVYHIFARNSAAIREIKEDGDAKMPDKRLAEELQLDTPRRYLQLVDGHPAPITDEDRWPFDLDHEEFPITHLRFNLTDSLYAFTDYEQMERLDLLSDDILRDVGIASFWAAVQKFVGKANLSVKRTDIEDFLSNPKTTFLEGLADSEGTPLIKELKRGQIDSAQIQAYDLIHDQSKEASGQSELLENADAQAYKDVTALATRVIESNLHQRVNRRLGGPWGYEQSIAEDAIKMLEIAHQFVPQVSQVAMMADFPIEDEAGPLFAEDGVTPLTEQKEDIKDLPWDEALKALSEGGQLIKLGVDAIVGPKLAQFWSYKTPAEHWRLSTKVTVEPGTTRSVTKEQQTAVMKQLYVEIFQPFYEMTGRIDLMRDFLEMIGRMGGVPNIDNKLPEVDELKKMMKMAAQQQQAQQEAEAMGEAGGQPLNSADANNGEQQTAEGQKVEAV